MRRGSGGKGDVGKLEKQAMFKEVSKQKNKKEKRVKIMEILSYTGLF